MVTTNQQIARYVDLVERKRALEAALKSIHQTLETVEDDLVNRYANEGLQSVKTSDGSTVYISRQVWASLQNNEHGEAYKALAESDLGWLVKPTVNHQQLSAVVRDWERGDDGAIALPEGLVPYIKISDRYRINVRLS